MFALSEIAEMKHASTEAMPHRFLATKEVSDTSGEPNGFGDYPTTTGVVYGDEDYQGAPVPGPAHVSDEEMMLKLRTQDLDFDAEAVVQVPDFPVANTEGLTCEAVFAGVRRPCRIVGIERGDVFDVLYVEFTGRGEAVATRTKGKGAA